MEDRVLILGKFADLQPGVMRELEVAGQKILLLRAGEQVWAVGAECPHAGGPLARGVFADGKIMCPWHKATFCLRTGECVDPPAVDGIPAFPLKMVNGDILLDDGERAPARAPPSAGDLRHFVVLGAGGAGFSAAQTLREAGFTGKITLVSKEPELPYDRTILSKYVLAGQEAGEKSPLQNDAFYEANKIERLVNEIKNLDVKRKCVTFRDGKTLYYDAALIATGSAVIQPKFPGSALENVFSLRTQDDAERIVAAAKKATRVVVIGASFIGMEVAASLRERGLEVTVIAGEQAPFERQLGLEVGSVFRKIHEDKGVKFRFGAEVGRLEGEGSVAAVLLAGGERIDANIVVTGIGVRPETGFIKALAREKDEGLEVDAYLRFGDDLYAAGDVAAFPSYGYGPLIRVEHWRVAEQQGRIAALNMLGQSAQYSVAPYFWTIQYGIRLDYVGHARGDDEIVIRGDIAEREFIAYYIRNGKVVGAAGMNFDKDIAALITLLGRRQNWSVDEVHPANSCPDNVLRKTGA